MARVILNDPNRVLVTDLEDGLYLIQWQPYIAVATTTGGVKRPQRVWSKEREVNLAVLERHIAQKQNSIQLEDNPLRSARHESMLDEAQTARDLLNEALEIPETVSN